jgi:drug/metabolite transporter (DMT)-like permease
MRRDSEGTILVIVSAVSFGFMPIFARFAYAQGVGVDELLFVRFLLAFLIMGTLLAASHRLVLPKRMDLLALIVLGALGYFLQSAFYFSALLFSPVAIVALLLYTYPVFVTVGAYLLGWEQVSRRLAGAFIIALIGLVLVANPFGTAIGLGVFLAFGSAIVYTIYILGGSKVLRRVKGDVAAFYVMGAASVSFGLTGALTGLIRLNWDVAGWFWVIIIAVICTVLAATTFFLGISRIGPSRAALISLMEPVTAVLLSLTLFGNRLTISQWFGGLLILVSTVITTLYGKPPKGVSVNVCSRRRGN